MLYLETHRLCSQLHLQPQTRHGSDGLQHSNTSEKFTLRGRRGEEEESQFNGENIKGKCRKRIIKGRRLKEAAVDGKKGERSRRERFIFAEGETIKAAMTVRN